MLKVLLKRRRHFFTLFYIYQHVNIFIIVILYIYIYIYIYICLKNIVIFYVEFTKKIIFFSLFTSQCFIQKFITILHVKWTEINMGKAGWKLEVLIEHAFCMTPKSFNHYFNLQSNTLPNQLNGFIPFFPMENIFPDSLINS